ncbi:hypothetical protein PVAND_012688 [Polypedilum vanderplanki]|uniref:Zinc finger protein n=1 Tax=Polypedilum vanderplanki TaxID=319348 RepID=A0A9J6CNA6_POLVA|nr:hypothetical protein PVAND_012688 [Polypedilum vanderplanki]
MWPGLCVEENCKSKSQVNQNKCRFHMKNNNERLPAEISDEEISDLALEIAIEFHEMILEDPSLIFYFGVSYDLDGRKTKHGSYSSYTAGFTYMQALARMPSTATASYLEYLVIKYFAEMAGSVHLKNQKPGDRYNPPNDHPSSLYVLVYENARSLGDPDPFPNRDFSDQFYFVRDYKRKFPKFPQLDIDMVKQNVKFSDVLRYLGYEVRQSKEEVAKTRREIYQCDQCPSSFPELYRLKEHVRLVHIKPHVCEVCGYSIGKAKKLQNHMKKEHNIDWTAPKKEKQKEYPCGISGCTEIFDTSLKVRKHRKTVHSKKTCHICKKTFSAMRIYEHYKQVHNTKKPKEEKKKKTNFYCELCNCYLSSSGGLKIHYKSKMHQENLKKK